MNTTTQIITTIIASVLASSGAWTVILYLVQKKTERKEKEAEKHDAKTKLLLALAQDRIYEKAAKAIAAGSMTSDEYETALHLYSAYAELGGNGLGERLFGEISKLPLKDKEDGKDGKNQR